MRRRNKRRWPVRILCILLVLALILAGGYAYLLVRYPLEYEDMIRTYAAEFDLEPAFVAAVIWAESSFRAEIQSGAGAVGLMQIMPETGAWIAGKLELAEFSRQQLTDPSINIRMGCWYLAYLERRFDGHTLSMLAGYNAGPKNVEKWQAQLPEGSVLQAEDIPFAETQQYVQRVERVQKIYERLYRLY